MRQAKTSNARIAVTLTPQGIDYITFLSEDKQEALEFYQFIYRELEDLQKQILARTKLDADMELLT